MSQLHQCEPDVQIFQHLWSPSQVSPPKMNEFVPPKKGAISTGNTSSNHHLSGDMFIFQGCISWNFEKNELLKFIFHLKGKVAWTFVRKDDGVTVCQQQRKGGIWQGNSC